MATNQVVLELTDYGVIDWSGGHKSEPDTQDVTIQTQS